MNEQPKSKVLVLIIGILLIANIIMLSFFIMNGRKDDRKDKARRNYVTDYLEKEVGFDAGQLARYDSLSKEHRAKTRSVFDELSPQRKTILKTLAEESFSDSAIIRAASHLHAQQAIFDFNMLKHLKLIRNICTKEQRQRFDTGFYKIVGKRRDTHKEK